MRGLRPASRVLLFALVLSLVTTACGGAAPPPTPTAPATWTPRPTFTAVPTRTSTPKVTATPTVTNTPIPTITSTPQPTNTAKPTETPKPTNTPAPPPPPPAPPTNTPIPPPTNTPKPAWPYLSQGMKPAAGNPNCGTQTVAGTIYGADGQGRKGVSVRIWAYGQIQSTRVSGVTDTDRGTGGWVHTWDQVASRDIQFEVAVVDANGNLLSEKVSGRTTKNCNPATGEALNQVYVDFVATQ